MAFGTAIPRFESWRPSQLFPVVEGTCAGDKSDKSVGDEVLGGTKPRTVCAGSVPTLAALYVTANGTYYGLPGVDPWDEARDARTYAGPHSVVAHPPCERWGQYATGSPRQPQSRRVGEDGGCFAAALIAVRNYGGVLEHPRGSRAWQHFGIVCPPVAGWSEVDRFGGRSCRVDQGHYGHISRKPTWLYAVAESVPELNWSRAHWAPDPAEIERIGFRAAQRNGALSCLGLKNRAHLRAATPEPFRDLLISIARTAHHKTRIAA